MNDAEDFQPPSRSDRPLLFGEARITPGVNVDRIDVRAGLAELSRFYANAPVQTVMVVEHALMRWARGEEAAAERGVIDRNFHGLDFGSWRRVLAAARAAGEAAA